MIRQHLHSRPSRPPSFSTLVVSGWPVKGSRGWVCLACRGNGRVVAPGERPDVIEGHKLSRRVDCPTCNGTGQGSEAEHRKEHRLRIARWKSMDAKWRAQLLLLRSARKKLTKAEALAVGFGE